MGIIVGDASVSFASGSGSTKLGDTKDDMHQMTGSFMLQADVSNAYAAVIDNDESSAGHVLKLLTDGNGSGTRILEMEDGDGDVVFRARADGRFGFGPDGVSSMGAGTFVVGIDNSSHTSDIAISRRLQHLGDGNTYLDFPSNDNITFAAGGSEELKIASDAILVKQDIKHDGDEDMKISFTSDQIEFDAGGVEFIRLTESDGQDTLYLNYTQGNVDVLISSQNLVRLFHADASTDRIGIGTASAETILHVTGTATIDQIVHSPTRNDLGSGTTSSITPVTGTLYFLDADSITKSGTYHELTLGNGVYDGQSVKLITSSSINNTIRLGASSGNTASGAVQITSSDAATLNGKTIVLTDASGDAVTFTYTTGMNVGSVGQQSAGQWMIGANNASSATDAAMSVAAGVDSATSAGDFSMSSAGGGSSATITLTQNTAGSAGNTSITGTAAGSVASFTNFTGGSDGSTNVNTVASAGIRINAASPMATLIWDDNSSYWQVIDGHRL